MDEDAFSYKSTHPEIEVSMSTHSIESVKAAYEHDLDYVFLVTFLRHLQNLINCLDQSRDSACVRDSYSHLCHWRYH